MAAVTGRAQVGRIENFASLENASVAQLREVFEGSFESKNWSLMVKVLDRMIQQGEEEGLVDLCLRAQALRNLVLDLKPELKPGGLLEEKAVGSEADADFLNSVAPVFEQTCFYLSHFHWSNRISH